MNALRRRQAWQTVRLELGRTFTLWGSVRLLFLAFAPAFIIAADALHDSRCERSEETVILGGIIQHYWFLAPVRRRRIAVMRGRGCPGTENDPYASPQTALYFLSSPRNVTTCDGLNCVQPALSPDGRSVAFVKAQD